MRSDALSEVYGQIVIRYHLDAFLAAVEPLNGVYALFYRVGVLLAGIVPYSNDQFVE